MLPQVAAILAERCWEPPLCKKFRGRRLVIDHSVSPVNRNDVILAVVCVF